MSTAKSPTVPLNNGVSMSLLGLGVYLSSSEETAAALCSAVACGYRLIDTASIYGNEREVGDGIRRCGVARSDLFITTKLWMTDYGYDKALSAFDASMEKLGLEVLDLYLIHWPTPATFDAMIDSYRAVEQLLRDKRVRAIGVSNFNPPHLDELLNRTEIVPAVNQVEIHPFFSQLDVREANHRHGIVTQAWSPIGGSIVNQPGSPPAPNRLLENATIVGLATQHYKTPAQIVLRWHIQHNVAVIPKSVQPKRIAENIDVFDFELTDADMAAIDVLDQGVRIGPDPETFDVAFLEARTKN